MQAIMETLFDVFYLSTVVILGTTMVRKGKSDNTKLFGYMALLLGFGDAFHLIPRAYGLLTTGLEANAAALGVGKFITSITMTIFYVVLYHIWRRRYQVQNTKTLTIWVYALAASRIALCLFPQNEWLNYYAPVSWGVYRNIPFAILGLVIIYLFYKHAKAHRDVTFKWMWFAIVLSFAFYIPVVLWATTFRLIGMLMIPKTLAYVWIIWMGYKAYQLEIKQ
ncbi:MAG TPA: hypothetical protein DCY20_02325 [Firmicutes bacterium]|nr:hypothetical protein [Bacillota bacterium]